MGISKVEFGAETLIDLTADTVTSSNLKQGVTAHGADGELIVGTYVPSEDSDPYPVRNDGHTHLWVNIPSLSDADVTIYLRVTANGGARINWGDGTTTATSGTAVASYSHTYTSTGLKEIILSHASTASRGYYFQTAYSIMGYSAHHFGDSNTKKLKAVEIGGTTATRARAGRFIGCTELEKVTIISTKNEELSLSNMLSANYSDDGVALVSIGFFLPKLKTLEFINCKPSFGSDSLTAAPILESVKFDEYGSIGVSMYEGCGSLKSIPGIFPSSATKIYEGVCKNCFALQTPITIPASVTEIGTGAFQNCRSLREIHFLPTTPPTLIDNTALSGLWNCTIYVPTGTIEDYRNAQYYPKDNIGENYNRIRYVEE